MKATTNPRAARKGPTLDDLMERRGLAVVDLASDSGVSVTTIWRARRHGTVPKDIYLAALARALRESVDETRAAIERSKGAA